MGINAVLDVVMGLVLMYLSLSMFCTVVNEFLATILGWRAQSLAAGIEKLLDDPILRGDFYNHGLIDGVRKASVSGSGRGSGGHPSYVSGRTFAMALLGSVDPTKPLPAISDVESAVRHLPDSNIRDVLLANLVAAGNDLTALRNGIAVWFDSAMDRLAGVYKRRLKYVSFVIGFVLAAALNADTIRVCSALWADGVMREQMVSIASHAASTDTRPAPASTTEGDLEASLQRIRSAEASVRPLPLGWHLQTMPALGIETILLKLAGLLFTAVALSLGAPFWFDLLSKFIQLRGTGPKPDRAEDA